MKTEKKYHFLYKTTNLINNKYYIGVHSTNDLDDGYLGSGTLLKRAICKKYGKENFKLEILEFFNNRDLLMSKERELVTETRMKDELCMNLKLGGSGGFSDEWQKRGRELAVLSLKEKRKDEEWVSKLGNSISNSLKERFKDNPPNYIPTFKGKKHTDEVRKKISIASSLSQSGEGNSQYGKLKSDETIRKISETLKLKHKNGEVNSHLYGAFWISNDELQISKKLKKGESIPDGWYKSAKYRIKKSK
jgi:hypothetical protein